MPRDTNISTIQLIEIVKTYPILYDITHPEFKNSFAKNRLWEVIGDKLNINGYSAKTKWKNLRDSYSKYLKSFKTTPELSGDKKYDRYNKWQWASNMEFVKDQDLVTADTNITQEADSAGHNEPQQNNNNNNNTEAMQHQIHASEQNFPTPSARSTSRKRDNRCNNDCIHNKLIKYLRTREPDKLSSTEHLMIGYAKTIDSFSERRKLLIKKKIAQIIMDNELEEYEERSATCPNRIDSQQYERHQSLVTTDDTSACYYSSPSPSHSDVKQEPFLSPTDLKHEELPDYSIEINTM